MRAYNPIVRRSLTASVAALALISLSACSSAPEAKKQRCHDYRARQLVDGPEFEAAASAATGYDVKVVTAGDGGELTNKLVLTKNAPIADAFFGVDNTFVFASSTTRSSTPTNRRTCPHYTSTPSRPTALQPATQTASSLWSVSIAGADLHTIDPACLPRSCARRARHLRGSREARVPGPHRAHRSALVVDRCIVPC